MNGFDMGCAMAKARGEEGTALVREILPSGNVLPALAEKLGTGEFALEQSLGETEGQTRCMLKWLDRPYPEFEPVYMGFALE